MRPVAPSVFGLPVDLVDHVSMLQAAVLAVLGAGFLTAVLFVCVDEYRVSQFRRRLDEAEAGLWRS